MPTGIFTTLAIEGELGILRCLHGILEKGVVEDRAQFSDLMTVVFKRCRFEYTALADDLGYSRVSVYRWVKGMSAPHKSLWPRIIEWIMTEIDKQEQSIIDCRQNNASFN